MNRREVIEKLAYYLQFLLILTSTLSLSSACPTDCICKWKGGKQSVECVNRGLRTFPGPIDPGTQVLDLQGNSFETLPPDHFMRLGLINLQKIYLSKCRLSHISPRTFRGLSNLVDLDLSYNVMREVPTGVFPDCQGLMRLILSGNTIPHIQRNAFISLESLTTLEISNAGVEIIEKGAFDGLVSLEWLRLNGNKLKRISGLGSLPLGLKGIWLEENPWDCDCRLLDLRLWLAERNVANSIEPRCASPPRLQNATLKTVSIDEFACIPVLSPTSMYQKIGEGKNVSLLCKVVSVPESSLEWWFNGQPVLNSSLNMLVETSNSNSNSNFPSSASSPSLLNNYNNNNNNNYYNINNNNNNNINNNHPTNTNNNNVGGGSGSVSSNSNGVERKSELLILNATVDENGTFLCLARNPAGVATANFTLKVLLRSETESTSENAVTSFVGWGLNNSSYPNALVIVVSTVSVIGLVIILFIITFLICKCSRRWACCYSCFPCCCERKGSGCRNPSHHHTCRYHQNQNQHQHQNQNQNRNQNQNGGGGTNINGGIGIGIGISGPCQCNCKTARCRPKQHSIGSNGSGGRDGKDGKGKDKDSASSMMTMTMGCAGKLNRHSSETSTLTTATKSNGSVFLLSTSSELGIGDSNPDLIEGVKRVEGDGHETCFSGHHSHHHHPHLSHSHSQSQTHGHSHNNGSNSNLNISSNLYGVPPISEAINPMSGGGLEPGLGPGPGPPFPLDYGLPKSLNVSTLVRRSPSNYNNDTQQQQMSMSIVPMSIPPNYDLAKYPKEYINPNPNQGQQQQQQALYTSGPHSMQLSNVIYTQGPPPPGGGGESFYMVTPDGNFLYNPTPEESFYMHQHYSQQQQQQQHQHQHHHIYGVGPMSFPMNMPMNMSMPPPSLSSTANCTCAPILEQSEEEKAAMEADDAQSSTGTDSTLPLPISIPIQTSTVATHTTSVSTSTSTSTETTVNTEHVPPAAESELGLGIGISSNGNGSSSSVSTSSDVSGGLTSTLKRRGEAGIVQRLQRQLKTQINESPDEGYEDESQEGTEI